ncbi:MAG: cytochrome c, partial [Polyangiaceae bacterium]|nr:cytochrome c [Polyangiaceae bacterium]
MTINFARALRALAWALCLAAVVLGTARARADQGDPPEIEAQRLVHLLGYIAADYGVAVQDGAVIAQAEYDEQLSLASEGAAIAARIQAAVPGGRAVDLAGGVRELRALLDRKAQAADVAASAASLRAEIIGAFRIEQAPRSAPDAARGGALFAEHCATCHGATGRADTARAATLTPRPANFHDPERGEALTAARVVGTIRFGVPGTSMVPFTFLDEAQRWDLAFFVTGLRHAGAVPAHGAPGYTLAELATRPDSDLRAELRAAGIPADREAAVLADLRLRAPFEDRAGRTPLGAARVKIDRARVAVARGDRDAARGSLIDAYLEGIEPAEAPVRAADAALARALEDRFLTLRARLEAGAPPAEIDAALASLLGDITRAEALISPSAAPRTFAST